jgi:hypothetical protein
MAQSADLHPAFPVEGRAAGGRPTVRKTQHTTAPGCRKTCSSWPAPPPPKCRKLPGTRPPCAILVRKRRDKARGYFDELAGPLRPPLRARTLMEGPLRSPSQDPPLTTWSPTSAPVKGTLAQLLAQRAEKVIADRLVREDGRLRPASSPASTTCPTSSSASATSRPRRSAMLRSGPGPAEPGAPSRRAAAGRAIAEAFRILQPGGRLIVLDLLQHTFEEARELYADRWLGFSEADLASMLEEAGFSRIETAVVDREPDPPKFATLLGVAIKPGKE